MSWECPDCRALNRDTWEVCALCQKPRGEAAPTPREPVAQPSSLVQPLAEINQPTPPPSPLPPHAPPIWPRTWPGLGRPTDSHAIIGRLEYIRDLQIEPPGFRAFLGAALRAFLGLSPAPPPDPWPARLQLQIRDLDAQSRTILFTGYLLRPLPLPGTWVRALGQQTTTGFQAWLLESLDPQGETHLFARV